MRKIWAARTGGCWLIARYPFMPASPSSGVGGVATTPGSRGAQPPSRRPRCGGASPLPSPLSTLARPSFPEQVARSRAHPSERCEVTPRTFTSGGWHQRARLLFARLDLEALIANRGGFDDTDVGGVCVGRDALVPTAFAADPMPADFKNAAKYCKAVRESKGVEAFQSLYGTNPNKKNAFGKCVSQDREREGRASARTPRSSLLPRPPARREGRQRSEVRAGLQELRAVREGQEEPELEFVCLGWASAGKGIAPFPA